METSQIAIKYRDHIILNKPKLEKKQVPILLDWISSATNRN